MSGNIDTPRLILRPFCRGDAEVAFAWFRDPDVMRFTPRDRTHPSRRRSPESKPK
jgi:RimJ/RimL family protein N-acetyltransferase